jgi:hypothetical protein
MLIRPMSAPTDAHQWGAIQMRQQVSSGEHFRRGNAALTLIVARHGMAIGAPRVAVSALIELHHLLIERGFRRSSMDDLTIVQEEQDEESADTSAAICGTAPTQHAVRFRKASGDEPLRTQDGARSAGQPPVGGRRRRGRGA